MGRARGAGGQDAGEQGAVVLPGEVGQRRAGGVDHGDGPRVGQQGPQRQPLADLMRAEHREGVAVLGAHQRSEFGGGDPAAFGGGGVVVWLGVGHGRGLGGCAAGAGGARSRASLAPLRAA